MLRAHSRRMTDTRATNENADKTQTCITRAESQVKQSDILSQRWKEANQAIQCLYFQIRRLRVPQPLPDHYKKEDRAVHHDEG